MDSPPVRDPGPGSSPRVAGGRDPRRDPRRPPGRGRNRTSAGVTGGETQASNVWKLPRVC